jgi:hypothetical protein
VGFCARAGNPATTRIVSPSTKFINRVNDWWWPTRVTQLKRIITSRRRLRFGISLTGVQGV